MKQTENLIDISDGKERQDSKPSRKREWIVLAILLAFFFVMYFMMKANATTATGGYYSGDCCNSYLYTAVDYSTSSTNTTTTISATYGIYNSYRSGTWVEWTQVQGYMNGECVYGSSREGRVVISYDSTYRWYGTATRSYERKCSDYTVPIQEWLFCCYVSGGPDGTCSGTHYRTDTLANVTVPAHTHYTIKYKANGGSSAPSSTKKCYDKSVTLSTKSPKRSGYTFVGWSTSSSTSPTSTSLVQPGASYSANANITYYAIWKPNPYTISFDANGGAGAPGNQQKIYGETLTLSSTVPTREGYEFIEWNTSQDGTGTSYAPGASYKDNAAATLYAKWQPLDFTVYFDGNGGKLSGSDFGIYEGKKNGELAVRYLARTGNHAGQCERDTYVFKGWYDVAGELVYDAEGTFVQGSYFDSNGKWMHLGDVTVYARWEFAEKKNQQIYFNFYGADAEEGMLDAEIEYNYTDLLGNKKTVKSRKAIITEKGTK